MPTGDDRRYKRFSVELTGEVILIPSRRTIDFAIKQYRSAGIPIYINDLSASGLCFICNEEYKLWQQLWIVINLGGKSVPVRGVVRRAFEKGANRNRGYGIQFLRSDFAQDAVSAVIEYLTVISLTEAKTSNINRLAA